MTTIDFKTISISDLAALVNTKFAEHNMKTVLVGGACVAIYSDDRYLSYDLDLFRCDVLDKLPDFFRNFRNLQILNLTECTLLQELPPSVFLLPNTCTVYISGCRFSDKVKKYLQAATEVPNYRGPQISYSARCSEEQKKLRPVQPGSAPTGSRYEASDGYGPYANSSLSGGSCDQY